MRRAFRASGIAGFCAALLLSQAALPPKVRRTLAAITAVNLKGDLSFLASDALKGRYTPSPELDIAAEFIAAQFREAGLEPSGNQDYFQTAEMIDRHMGKAMSQLTVETSGRKISIPPASITLMDASQAGKIDNAPLLVFKSSDPALLRGADIAGKAILIPAVDFRKMPREQALAAYRNMRAFNDEIASSKTAVEIMVGRESMPASRPSLISADEVSHVIAPRIFVASEELAEWMQRSADRATVSVEFSGPEDRRVTLKNVIGVLKGSDPRLKDTYVLVTAHYDHIGTRETADGTANPNAVQNAKDAIYNGANDDGSGTVSVIEIGRALAKLRPHPRRSIVLMTFFGEERGEIGSHFYVEHPVFPLAKTVADVNLEQVGRTDSTVGKQIRTASLTGYDYSDVVKTLERAGRETGIRVYKDSEASDPYFTQSDNAGFAEAGVPAHTLCVAFDYPDYHGLGDEWQKIDYDNMARVDQMVALGVIDLANSVRAPRWDAENAKTKPFREAQAKLTTP